MSEHKAPLEQIWRVCAYLRSVENRKCKRCPRTFEDEHHGTCHHMCFGIAEQTINVVETGNPWRKDKPWPGDAP